MPKFHAHTASNAPSAPIMLHLAWLSVKAIGPGQFAKSWRNSNEIPDRAEAEGAVKVVEELFSRFPANPV